MVYLLYLSFLFAASVYALVSDKLVQEDFPLSDDVKAQLKVYRQALRDLPDNYPSTFTTVDDANPGEIDTSSFWPEHPDIS